MYHFSDKDAYMKTIEPNPRTIAYRVVDGFPGQYGEAFVANFGSAEWPEWRCLCQSVFTGIPNPQGVWDGAFSTPEKAVAYLETLFGECAHELTIPEDGDDGPTGAYVCAVCGVRFPGPGQ